MQPGPGLHSSLCYLFVTRGVYKEALICPKQSQKMIQRIDMIAYKNGLPMSDKAFGLTDLGEPSLQKMKKRKTNKSPRGSKS